MRLVALGDSVTAGLGAVATVLVGVNDTLRGTFELDRIGARLERVIATLSVHATVLTARLPDPGILLRRPLARRVGGVNALLDELARAYDTVHVALDAHPALYERRMWSVDRPHPSERGHRMLARLFAAEPGASLPGEEPDGPVPTPLQSARWMAVEGTGWVISRSRDFLPHYSRLVLNELRNRTECA